LKKKFSNKNSQKIIHIRNDLFPGVEKIFQKYIIDARIEIIQSIFSSTFKDNNEVIDFINNLSDQKDAELLIETAAFLYVLKFNVNETFKSVWLIGLFSVFEKLNGPDWQDYTNWINKKNNSDINKIISKFKEIENSDYLNFLKKVNNKYLEKYGAIKRVRDFTNKYLQTKTKIMLISSLKTKKTKFVSGYTKRDRPELKVKNIEELKKYGFIIHDFFMPECYDWEECYIKGRNCSIDKCPLNHDTEKLETQFNKAIKILYTFRSNFVHDANIPPVRNGHILGRYKKNLISIDIQFDRFWEECLKGIIEFFKNKIEN